MKSETEFNFDIGECLGSAFGSRSHLQDQAVVKVLLLLFHSSIGGIASIKYWCVYHQTFVCDASFSFLLLILFPLESMVSQCTYVWLPFLCYDGHWLFHQGHTSEVINT